MEKPSSDGERFDGRFRHGTIRPAADNLQPPLPGNQPLLADAPVPADHAARAAAGRELFRTQVRSLLTTHCLDCHGGKSVKGDFNLANRELLMDSGFVDKTADDSYLIELVEHRADPHMPYQAEKLRDEQIAVLRKWIDLGAVYDKPLAEVADSTGPPAAMQVTNDDRQFWSFQPLRQTEPPSLEHDDWSTTPIDRFVLERLRAAGLTPNGIAERRVLIRRAYFGLLGLPPAPEEVDAFVNDTDPRAWERLVDRLLDSEHYGERWARHWLDIARFAESHGYEQDYDRQHAYHYRDFLIQALNADMPFDQFTRWQLAGDELAPEQPLAMMATGFLGAGSFPTQLTEMEFESARYDELDDMVATTGVAFLGLSTGCARCHDHKFDPIPTADYYRLASVFATTIRSEIELDLDPAANEQLRVNHAAALANAKQPVDREQQAAAARFEAWLTADDEPLKLSDLSSSPWRTPAVDSVVSTAGTQFTLQADGSWLASGSPPAAETITVTARGTFTRLGGVRLEALSDPSMPHGGPGRAPNGNFAIGDFKLEWRPASNSPDATARENNAEWRLVALSNPRATHQQNDGGLSVAASIDQDRVSGWAVDMGGIGKSQAAAFDCDVTTDGPSELRWTLVLEHPNKQHTLGRFRISLAERPGVEAAVDQSTVPATVVEAAKSLRQQDLPAAAREAARKTLLDWYLTTDEPLAAAKEQLRKLEEAGPKVKLTKVMVTSEGYPHMPHHADGRGFPHFFPVVHRLQRGDVRQKQEVAEPGFLQVLLRDDVQPNAYTVERDSSSPPRTSLRRTALANWITDVDHGAGPLLARVIVNRLWQHHFGEGLVATPNDFGVSGSPPSHPELLEWLANDLVEHGWQLKRLHRQILMSSVYRQSGDFDESRATLDRENRLHWRRSPRRLEAEAVRDSMLAVSGILDPKMYGPGTLDANMRRRSIYFFIKRSQLIPMLMLFDWPEHLVSIGQRSSTTIAPQALMFLNSPQGRDWSRAFAARFETLNDQAFIAAAYQRALSRPPTAMEAEAALQFLTNQSAGYAEEGRDQAQSVARIDFCQALLGSNEFLYIE
ncbi:MAG: DUF1553 domain-containing protein [Planctomycetaceae bacterium]